MQKADSPLSWEAAVAELKLRPGGHELVRACFYDDPLIEAAQRYWKSAEWQAVRSYLPSSTGTALDVGSGRGISAYALARDGWSVTALEPDCSETVGAGAIRALQRDANLNIDIVETWGEELPFESASFDVVHCRQVLHHARDLGQLCRQIGRVLKPRGVFIATREHVISRSEDLAAFLQSHPLHHLYGGENAYLLDDYLTAIREGGIRIDQVLNPLASEINLFPSSQAELKERWAKRLRLPSPHLVPSALLTFVGARSKEPGRLFSFIGTKVCHD